VLFNIGGPALNQLNETASKKKNTGAKRSVAVGLGLTAASMLAAQNADAAEAIVEAAQKVNDNRVGIIATVFVVSTESQPLFCTPSLSHMCDVWSTKQFGVM
jgi:photosystem II PsbY protein